MQEIGFIGVGIVGKPVAGHLLKVGYPLFAHDLSHEPVQELTSSTPPRWTSIRLKATTPMAA